MPPSYNDCTRRADCVNPIHLTGCAGLATLLAESRAERAIWDASKPVKKKFD